MTSVLVGPCDAAVAAATVAQRNPHPRATLAATILGSSVAFIDGSVVNVALPALASDLEAGPAGLSWTINAYLLPLAALTLFGGAAGDHFGRRRLFLVGLAIFALASTLCAVAPNLTWLLVGRSLQGFGAALLMPNSLAILGSAFDDEARGRAVGNWAAAGALTGALGPLIGGWFVDAGNWRAIFLLNLPIAAVTAWLAWFYVPESEDLRKEVPLDWAGALTASAALGFLTWSLTSGAQAHASPLQIWLSTLAGLSLLGGFVWFEARRGDTAIMPLAMFGTLTFTGLTLLTLLLYASLGGLLVLLPYFLIRAAGYSAMAAGAAMLPLPILIGIGSPLTAKITARYGTRRPLAVGAATVAAGFGLCTYFKGGSIDYWSDILPATLLIAGGMSVIVAPLTAAVMSAVDADHVGAASGFNSTIARIGGMLATALLGFVFALQESSREFVEAFRLAALTGAFLAALAAACALCLMREPRAE